MKYGFPARFETFLVRDFFDAFFDIFWYIGGISGYIRGITPLCYPFKGGICTPQGVKPLSKAWPQNAIKFTVQAKPFGSSRLIARTLAPHSAHWKVDSLTPPWLPDALHGTYTPRGADKREGEIYVSDIPPIYLWGCLFMNIRGLFSRGCFFMNIWRLFYERLVILMSGNFDV